ncbi:M15 family metallopeptidase [Undibacterium sp. Jales W-56]|uniref:M15 family metallopeptidase n=1 Tax=Undibacterium sp. Jales W-56 TaxID=2897325 RepID=UPI0021CFF167|nr:M15 family metallopeptidase [Undibacterium sp. Jales W-56]MCU6432917.1 M15 family metallopeptidase [Undibacterium sp. Jales W-56]
MFFLLVALYFLLACFAAWLLLFPVGREAVVHTLQDVGARIERRLESVRGLPGSGFESVRNSFNGLLEVCSVFVTRHVLILTICLVAVCLPPLIAWLASDKNMLDGFDVPTRQVNSQVADLLKGEQLAPPAALPPLLFTTEEVLQVRPMLFSASRNWQLLDNDFSQRLLLTFKIMKEKHGYEMAILEGYRSPERQNMLAAMGVNVTNARAFQSFHQYGLAADCAFLRNGKLVISEKDEWTMRGYQLYGEVAESVGLHWGGRWKMMDFGHTELRSSNLIKNK